MNNFNRLLESKDSKKGIDIGDGFRVHKIGHDANGNWSYVISKGNKTTKIQAANINNGSGKITNIEDFKDDLYADEIKEYAKKYSGF